MVTTADFDPGSAGMTSPAVPSVSTASRALNINSSTTPPNIYLNRTESGFGLNETNDWPGNQGLFTDQASYGLGTTVTVAIALGTAAVVIVIVIVVVCVVRRHYHKKKTKAWVDNLTLSYIADSNVDLTKDAFDELVSLDNDNFLNSLDSHSFSVFSPDSSSRQYSYSYF